MRVLNVFLLCSHAHNLAVMIAHSYPAAWGFPHPSLTTSVGLSSSSCHGISPFASLFPAMEPESDDDLPPLVTEELAWYRQRHGSFQATQLPAKTLNQEGYFAALCDIRKKSSSCMQGFRVLAPHGPARSCALPQADESENTGTDTVVRRKIRVP